jgi:hypothetical protein
MVGAIMALVGLMTALILFSAQRSAVTGSMLRLLSQMVGWGIYVLPFGLIVMGLWLILRRIEKLPPLSLERATGFILFFLWLLAVLLPPQKWQILQPSMAPEAVSLGLSSRKAC